MWWLFTISKHFRDHRQAKQKGFEAINRPDIKIEFGPGSLVSTTERKQGKEDDGGEEGQAGLPRLCQNQLNSKCFLATMWLK